MKSKLVKEWSTKIFIAFFIFRYNILVLNKFAQKPCKCTYTVFALRYLRIFNTIDKIKIKIKKLYLTSRF